MPTFLHLPHALCSQALHEPTDTPDDPTATRSARLSSVSSLPDFSRCESFSAPDAPPAPAPAAAPAAAASAWDAARSELTRPFLGPSFLEPIKSGDLLPPPHASHANGGSPRARSVQADAVARAGS